MVNPWGNPSNPGGERQNRYFPPPPFRILTKPIFIFTPYHSALNHFWNVATQLRGSYFAISRDSLLLRNPSFCDGFSPHCEHPLLHTDARVQFLIRGGHSLSVIAYNAMKSYLNISFDISRTTFISCGAHHLLFTYQTAALNYFLFSKALASKILETFSIHGTAHNFVSALSLETW